MKKYFGIVMLAVTLLSGITVLAQNTNSSTTMRQTDTNRNMSSSRRRHHRRRHARRWHRQNTMKHGNKNDKH